MHHAPSVTYPVGRVLLVPALDALALSWVLAMALAWWWSLSGGVLPWAWWALCVAGAMASWRAWADWRAGPVAGRLSWQVCPAQRDDTGQPVPAHGAWYWHSPAYRHGTRLLAVQWAWDGQEVVLLRLRNAAGVRWWVWLSAAAAPKEWQALRVALVSHATHKQEAKNSMLWS